MAGGDAQLAVAEILPEELGVFQAEVEQGALACGAEVGDARLVEVPCVVELVTELRVEQPALLVHPLVPRAVGMHGAEGVEVAVGFLRGGDAGDPAVERGLECRVLLHAEHVGGALDGLVGVGVVEGVDGGRRDLEVLLTGGAPAQDLGGEVEILQAAGLLALLHGEGEGDLAVGLLLLLPETARDAHGGEGHGLERIVGCLGEGARGKPGEEESRLFEHGRRGWVGWA